MKETTINILCSLLKLISLLLISDNQTGEEFQTASSELDGNGTHLSYRMTEIEAQNRQQKKGNRAFEDCSR